MDDLIDLVALADEVSQPGFLLTYADIKRRLAETERAGRVLSGAVMSGHVSNWHKASLPDLQTITEILGSAKEAYELTGSWPSALQIRKGLEGRTDHPEGMA